MLAALADGQSAANEIDASRIAAPKAIDARSIVTPQDYPTEALRSNEQGFILSRLTINESGKVDQCDILISSKSNSLDKITCDLFKKRGKFTPAIYIDGKESFGIHKALTQWAILPNNERVTHNDVSIELSRLPNNLQSPKRAYLSVAVDEDGKPLACRYVDDGRATLPLNTNDPQLIVIGCKQIMAGEFPPARTRDGRAVPSVQGVQVEFTTPGSADSPSGTPASLSIAVPAGPDGH